MGIKEREHFDSYWDLRIWGLGFPARVGLSKWFDSKWKGQRPQTWETAGPGLPGTVLVASVVSAVINNSSSCSLKYPGLGHQDVVTLGQAAVHARAAVSSLDHYKGERHCPHLRPALWCCWKNSSDPSQILAMLHSLPLALWQFFTCLTLPLSCWTLGPSRPCLATCCQHHRAVVLGATFTKEHRVFLVHSVGEKKNETNKKNNQYIKLMSIF